MAQVEELHSVAQWLLPILTTVRKESRSGEKVDLKPHAAAGAGSVVTQLEALPRTVSQARSIKKVIIENGWLLDGLRENAGVQNFSLVYTEPGVQGQYLPSTRDFWFQKIPYDKKPPQRLRRSELPPREAAKNRRLLKRPGRTSGRICAEILLKLHLKETASRIPPLKRSEKPRREKGNPIITITQGEFFTYLVEYELRQCLTQKRGLSPYLAGLDETTSWRRRAIHEHVMPWIKEVVEDPAGEYAEWHRLRKDWFILEAKTLLPRLEKWIENDDVGSFAKALLGGLIEVAPQSTEEFLRRLRFHPEIEYELCTRSLASFVIGSGTNKISGHSYALIIVVSFARHEDLSPSNLQSVRTLFVQMFSREAQNCSTRRFNGQRHELQTPPVPVGSRISVKGNRNVIPLMRPPDSADEMKEAAPKTKQPIMPQHPSHSMVRILEENRDQDDLEALGLVVDQLVRTGDGPGLVAWLDSNGEEWLREKRVALGAVIEAGAVLEAPGVEEWVLKVLEYSEADPTVAATAAQRIRLLHVSDPAIRQRFWSGLKDRIEKWLKMPEYREHALRALPSVPYVTGSEAVKWLRSLIEAGSVEAAWAVSLGVLDWAAGNCTETEPMNDEVATAFSESVVKRLQEPRHAEEGKGDVDVRATLVWVLGAIVTKSTLAEVVQIIVNSYTNPQGMEDAAALRAARLLRKNWGKEAWDLLAGAFGGHSSPQFYEFWNDVAVAAP